MLSPGERDLIVQRAYVPEHVVGLMEAISGGEASLVGPYLVYRGEGWAIVVGYPLDGTSPGPGFSDLIAREMAGASVEALWAIAPDIPHEVWEKAADRGRDEYLVLDTAGFTAKGGPKREAQKAREKLRIERTRIFTAEHALLVREFLARERPGTLIENLYGRLERYIERSDTAALINAVTDDGGLTAFYVVDLGGEAFATYLVGCHSKERYVPHASDLLFLEMVALARESGKERIHLGLGVNRGIRRFKEKWGGVPHLPYAFVRLLPGGVRPLAILKALESLL